MKWLYAPARTPCSEIRSELIRASYRSPVLSPVLNMIAAVAVAILFIDAVSPGFIALWLVLVFVTAAARVGALAIFRRREPPMEALPRWGVLLLGTMGLNASAWGAAAYLLYVPGSFHMQMNQAAFVSVTAVFVTMSTSYRPLILAYQALAIPPLMVMLIIGGTRDHYTTAFIMGLLSVTTLVIGSARVRTVRELIQLRMELAREKEAAEQANLAKSKFLAAASHDLRQPLHALGIFSSMLAARAGTPEERELSEHILGSVAALKMLLNALLDISKLDAGSVVPRREDFALAGLFGRLAGEYAPQARTKGLRLTVEECETGVNSDPALLETVLRNLLSNAIRYTEHGRVSLRCRTSDRQVMVEVVDTGIGIARKDQSTIFREFHQLHNTERDRSKGLGLGLAIIDRLLHLLDHDLTLTSSPGRGSTFTITLPQASGPLKPGDRSQEDQNSGNHEDSGQMCVLVVDDEQPILNATRLLLESWGLQVITADSPRQAVEAISRGTRAPQVMIADLRLRDGDSAFDAIEAVHAHLRDAIPSLIITGDTAPERLQALREGGYPVLNKPVAPARIRAFLRQVQRNLAHAQTV